VPAKITLEPLTEPLRCSKRNRLSRLTREKGAEQEIVPRPKQIVAW